MLKKFIKVNLIILVIFSMISSYLFIAFSSEDEVPTIEVVTIHRDEEGNIIDESNGENGEENQEEEKSEEDQALDELELKKSSLESGIEDSNAQIQIINEDMSAEVAEITELNQKIYDKQLEIETLEAEEKNVNKFVEAAEREYEKSNERYLKQKDLLETRMVIMYEMGETSFLDILLNSKTMSDFLSNYYMINEITNADIDLLKKVEDEKSFNKKLTVVLEEKKQALEDSRKTREKNAILLENMSTIRNSRIAQLSDEEAELQQKIEEYQNQINDIEKEIRVLALARISDRYVGGSMAWPVPGYTRITSQFGMRTHPITGIYKLHTGVDIGAPRGAEFIAANDGVVTYAGWNGAYGNMVIVDHGGGITTLYGHGSEILVSQGQSVEKGTPVLKVGSTGYSTGPHAHFEVRINGEYVQPLDYITSYSSQNKEVEKIEIN